MDAYFDTKLASKFLHFHPKRDAENKSSSVESVLKVQFLMEQASFQSLTLKATRNIKAESENKCLLSASNYGKIDYVARII